MCVPNCTAGTVYRNHYSRLLVGWCPVYSSVWSYALYGYSRACVPSSGGGEGAPPQAVLAVMAEDTASKQC